MKFFLIAALMFLVLGPALRTTRAQQPNATPPPHAAPVNPNATPEARELLKRIDDISGHYTLTGQHNFPNHVSRWSDRVYDLTGKFPGVFGSDFGFSAGEDKDSIEGRPAMIEEAKRQYRNGAVIALCWHEVRPTDDEPVTFRDSVQGHLTDYEWNELLTPGTDIYKRWVEQVDVVAGYLKQLQDANVPVLFRPYHEMNGNWFWWGGRPGPKGSAALYRQLFDRFVNVHHLNNLIWVWNSDRPSGNAGSIADFYPGDKFADVVTIDIYGEYLQSYYDTMLSIAGDKPIALGEVGTMPTLDVLAKQPRWAYLMMWSGMESANSPEQLQAVFHAPNMLNRGDPPFVPATTAPTAPAVEPVCPSPSSSAKELLNRLHSASGTQTLSGQQNDSASLNASTDQVYQATGKYPSIYAVDLDASNTQALLDETKRQAKAGSIISLNWRAPNPAEDATPGHDSRQRALTEYEWKELVTSGSPLNLRWAAQVDTVAAALKQLDDEGIPVLFSPYPGSNSKQNWWWGNHSGVHGSAALYRMLFDRLVNHHHLHNLLWVWAAAPPGFGPQASGAFSDFFPGLLYVDALSSKVLRLDPRFRAGSLLHQFAGDKAVGLTLTGLTPDPSAFARDPGWSWFILSPRPAVAANAPPDDATSQPLKALYADPHIVSR